MLSRCVPAGAAQAAAAHGLRCLISLPGWGALQAFREVPAETLKGMTLENEIRTRRLGMKRGGTHNALRLAQQHCFARRGLGLMDLQCTAGWGGGDRSNTLGWTRDDLEAKFAHVGGCNGKGRELLIQEAHAPMWAGAQLRCVGGGRVQRRPAGA